jgi:hypothetical protein
MLHMGVSLGGSAFKVPSRHQLKDGANSALISSLVRSPTSPVDDYDTALSLNQV